MPPVGFPSYNHDFMVTYSLLAANQVMSLIFDGVFDRFPTCGSCSSSTPSPDPAADVADGRRVRSAQVVDRHSSASRRSTSSTTSSSPPSRWTIPRTRRN